MSGVLKLSTPSAEAYDFWYDAEAMSLNSNITHHKVCSFCILDSASSCLLHLLAGFQQRKQHALHCAASHSLYCSCKLGIATIPAFRAKTLLAYSATAVQHKADCAESHSNGRGLHIPGLDCFALRSSRCLPNCVQ